jgi:undecaprenyl diphosphate synthase
MATEQRALVHLATMPMRLHTNAPTPELERKPQHLAIVLQGHLQWALRNALSDVSAMSAAAGRFLELIDYCAMLSIKKVTLCLFSDDLSRFPLGGNGEFAGTFMRYLSAGAQNMHRNDVRLQIEGSLSGLDGVTRGLLSHVVRRTHLNAGMQLVVDVDGSQIGGRPRDGSGEESFTRSSPNAADSAQVELPGDPDFVIRTGGHLPAHRAMLWDTGKTALFFTDLHWPDFSAKLLQEALDWYGDAHRDVGIQSPLPILSHLHQH